MSESSDADTGRLTVPTSVAAFTVPDVNSSRTWPGGTSVRRNVPLLLTVAERDVPVTLTVVPANDDVAATVLAVVALPAGVVTRPSIVAPPPEPFDRAAGVPSGPVGTEPPQAAATTLRGVKTATVNDWSAICWHGGEVCRSKEYPGLEIFDRVGGGDSFASGLIYGLLAGETPQRAVELGAAHGALAMTKPGDNSMASLAEVERVAAGGGARVVR